MTGQMSGSLDTSGLGLVHDVQLDYYGKRAAAASSDNTVHIWDITGEQQKTVGVLKGHEGPVWKVSWAHPKFGSLLATCGYDMKVIVWKEVQGQWQMAYADASHAASVNDVEFCPWEHGLRLACASSDGMVSVLTHSPNDQQWRRSVFSAHPGGAQTLSWMPVQHRDGAPAPGMRLATGGCDNSVCIWKCEGEAWSQESPPLPPAHTDWVRGVAWRPDGSTVVASGGWDKTVVIWAQEMEGQPWRQVCRLSVAGRVECLSWSVTGGILAVSFADADSATIMYKEASDGSYEEVGRVGEQGYQEVPSKSGGGPPVSLGGASAPPAPGAPSLSAELAAQQQAALESSGLI